MMAVHPLFSGFAGYPLDLLGQALGFELRTEARPGALPAYLSFADEVRMGQFGDLAEYRFAGGWEAGGQHVLLFAKPINGTAERMYEAALRPFLAL